MNIYNYCEYAQHSVKRTFQVYASEGIISNAITKMRLRQFGMYNTYICDDKL